MNLDDTRRKLRETEMELGRTKNQLLASEERCKRLQTAKTALEVKAHKAVGLLLPEGTSLKTNWDNYKEPGY